MIDAPWTTLNEEQRWAVIQHCIDGHERVADAAIRLQVSPASIFRWSAARGKSLTGIAPPALPNKSAQWFSMTPEEKDTHCVKPLTLMQAGQEVGVGVMTISAWRAKRKLKAAPPKRNTPRHPKTTQNPAGGDTRWLWMTVEERTEAILESFKKKQTRKSLAAELGCSWGSLSAFINKHKISTPPPVTQRVSATNWHTLSIEAKIAMVENFRKTSVSQADLARKLDIDASTLKSFAVRHGIVFNYSRIYAGFAAQIVRNTTPTVNPHPAHPVYPGSLQRPGMDTTTRVHLLDIRFGQCRFPLWPDTPRVPIADMFYCGDTVEHPKTPYCVQCRKLTIRPPLQRSPARTTA